MPQLMVSAPGRICLFGEHQDFLGLPVVAAAINMRIRVTGSQRGDSLLRIRMPDIGCEDAVDLSKPVSYTRPRDYLRSCINVLRGTGWDLRTGYDCTIESDIPISSGVSSSSALVVAWLRFLLEAAQVGIAEEDLARLAHRAEVLEFGEPGGMMDHFASALGGIIEVDTRPPYSVRKLELALDGLVLGDSLEKKRTLAVLSDSRCGAQLGFAALQTLLPGFDLHVTPLQEVEPVLERLPDAVRCAVRANLVNRDLAVEALEMLRGNPDWVRLGRLLTSHHEQLRDGLRVSTPKIDNMLEAALSAGALGGKINGSGGGGCMFAYAPGNESEIARAMERTGGEAHLVKVDEGARVEVSSS